MLKQVLINIEDRVVRVAFLEGGEVVELFIEQMSDKTIVGNIYRGIVEDVLPGLKATFVDIGLERRAFLHFDDFKFEALFLPRDEMSRLGLNYATLHRNKKNKNIHNILREKKEVKVEEFLRRGMPIMVQVIKDEIGKKSARVTTNISLPGRYLVLLPFPEHRGGISKRISDYDERQRLRKILKSFRSTSMGFIIRTAGYDQDEDNLRRDMIFLKNEWNQISRLFRRLKQPTLVYNDHDIFYRLVRDIFNYDLNEVIVDDPEVLRRIKNILKIMLPGLDKNTKLFNSSHRNLFDVYDIERQIQRAAKRKVWLKNGGFIVFDETEALTAIDVNTGHYTGHTDQENTIVKTNLEATEVIAQQIRLRDIGGLIVIDFIDMLLPENKELIEREFKNHLKRDRSKMAISKLSDFGLLEMTRKRVHESLKNIIFTDCPYCEGSGKILNSEEIWRKIKYSVLEKIVDAPHAEMILLLVHPDIKKYIETNHSQVIKKMSQEAKFKIQLIEDADLHIEDFRINVVEKEEKQKNLRLKHRGALKL